MSSAERAGLSAARLAVLDRVIKEKYVDSGDTAGTLIHVWRRGELVHTGMAGMMDLERSRPMREDAIFRIYSMTKPITGVALMMLVEDGLIDLNDDVARYIPAWKDLGVFAGGSPGSFSTTPPARPMKIVDLATHTSGLTYDWMSESPVDAAYRGSDIWHSSSLEAFMEKLGKIPLEFSPGTAWNYSVSTDALGYIISKVSGMSFGAFLESRLFAPLGMTDTAFHCPPEKLDRLASCYQVKDGRLVLDASARDYAIPPRSENGGSGLVSTAHDYMRFCRMLLAGGSLDGVRYLSPKTVALFGTNMLPDGKLISDMYFRPKFADWGLGGSGQSIGCGVTLDVAASRTAGTPGDFYWSGAALTQFWVDPREDLAVVFMTQVVGSPHDPLVSRVLRNLVYSAFTESNVPH